MKGRILADLERLATQCGAVIDEGGADFSDVVSCAVAVLAVVEHMIDGVKYGRAIIPENVVIQEKGLPPDLEALDKAE